MKHALWLCSLLITLCFTACQRPVKILQIDTHAIAIDQTLTTPADSSYLQRLQPITDELDQLLDIQIGYAPEDMLVHAPECKMLNWASDALLAKARQYYPEQVVDFAVVNIGGMRAPWYAGPITKRHIYILMPFDNTLVVLTLKGEDVLELCQGFVKAGGEGVAGLRLQARNGELTHITIGGEELNPEAYYHVATSNYLAGGMDKMSAFTKATSCWNSDLLIRDLYMEYATEQNTITATIDGRMDIQ